MIPLKFRKQKIQYGCHTAGKLSHQSCPASDFHNSTPERQNPEHSKTQAHGFFCRVQKSLGHFVPCSITCTPKHSGQEHSAPQIIQQYRSLPVLIVLPRRIIRAVRSIICFQSMGVSTPLCHTGNTFLLPYGIFAFYTGRLCTTDSCCYTVPTRSCTTASTVSILSAR